MAIYGVVNNMDSIIQTRKACYVCGASDKLHCHHVFYGTANRKKSDEDGMVIYLCPAHHNLSSAGIHFNKNLDNKVKQQAEKIWIQNYTAESSSKEERIKAFIERYGRNYLDE